MKTSESIEVIYAALIKAQAEFVNLKKDATNPFFQSQYVELAQVLESIRPIMAKNDLGILQFPGLIHDNKLSLTTRLIHTSGEWLEDISETPLQANTPQGFGSTLTYQKRYDIVSILGLIADEDDDGNKGTETTEEVKNQTAKAQPTQSNAVKPAFKPQTNKVNINVKLIHAGRNEIKKWSEYNVLTEDSEGREKEITILIKKPYKELQGDVTIINYKPSEFKGKTYHWADDIIDNNTEEQEKK